MKTMPQYRNVLEAVIYVCDFIVLTNFENFSLITLSKLLILAHEFF
jgi:hypothetical protein